MLAVALFVLCATGAGWIAETQAQGTCTLRRGLGAGMWELPLAPGAVGSLDGVLYDPSGPVLLYHFAATLNDVPTPCLSCIEGTVAGTLDDGIGPGPDYIVQGSYKGLFLNGTGTFKATIYKTIGPAFIPVGRMHGVFDDPPGIPGPGDFKCRWAICD
jgi:hypothetical protein